MATGRLIMVAISKLAYCNQLQQILSFSKILFSWKKCQGPSITPDHIYC